jgi:SAM-dependent methyltransferase
MAKTAHGQKEVREIYEQRGLDSTYPQLTPYLSTGDHVLDVGCGPGTVTLDVAKAVYPGEVVGIDPTEESIARGNESSDNRGVKNARFQVGNALALEFGDREFDVVYALSVFGYLPEPAKALAEMRRVTRKKGWVFVTMEEEGPLIRHPPCPVYEKVRAILHQYWTDPGDPDHYYDWHLGRRSLELFKGAGLTNITIENRPHGIRFRGEEPMSIEYDLRFLDHEQMAREFYSKIFYHRALDKETVLQARDELKRWAAHPHATVIPRMEIVAAGQA